MQSDDGASAYPIKTTQTEPEVAPTNPAQICFVPVESGNVYNNYKHTQSKICGAIQIFLGLLSILLNVCDIIYTYYGPAIIGHGIWCGVVVSRYIFIVGWLSVVFTLNSNINMHMHYCPPGRTLARPPARPPHSLTLSLFRSPNCQLFCPRSILPTGYLNPDLEIREWRSSDCDSTHCVRHSHGYGCRLNRNTGSQIRHRLCLPLNAGSVIQTKHTH